MLAVGLTRTREKNTATRLERPGSHGRQRQRALEDGRSREPLTSRCPHISDPRARQTNPADPPLLAGTQETEKAVLARERYNGGAASERATRPHRAEKVREAERGLATGGREGKERGRLQFKHRERWKAFWLREQGRKRGG